MAEKRNSMQLSTGTAALAGVIVGLLLGWVLFGSGSTAPSGTSVPVPEASSSAAMATPEAAGDGQDLAASSDLVPAVPVDESSREEDASSSAGETSGAGSGGLAASSPASDAASASSGTASAAAASEGSGGVAVYEDASYTSKEEVAAYIDAFGHLPPNFVSKTKARNAGWVASEGNLDEVLPGMSIGGSEFYNDEGLLPDAPGRTWTECDINYEGGYRGAERIVFSSDGLVFYTADHYESFEQLY